MMSYKENLQKCHEYVRALEEERRKIQMFQRELPLCLEIVSQTLESCKQQLSGTTTATVPVTVTATLTATTTTPECSEQTTSDGFVFEEFIPIKKACSSARDDGEEKDSGVHKKDESKKSDWLRSAQLWNQSPDPLVPTTKETQEEHPKLFPPAKKVPVVEVRRNASEMATAATLTDAPAAAASSCSTAERGGSKKEDGQNRKARRCWSPELHRRFLSALEQLGGPHVATPKQIRELMKVDGLTNDEVKSHLQKYRLHSTRRPASTASHHSNGAGSAQAPPPPPHQFVVVYAPVARPIQQQQAAIASQSAGSHSENGTPCNSPATSSSAPAAAASPAS